MTLPAPDLLDHAQQPIRRAVRRLRWFKASFAQQVEGISRESGVRFDLSSERLVEAFLEWLRAFEAQKPRSPGARMAYVGFASGLMLRQLVKSKPLSVLSVPDGADPANPAYFWPEGYVYVAYCLNVRRAILEQEFDETRQLSPDFDDLRTWWSFRENVDENASAAISFLDLFAGDAPNWEYPSVFYAERPGLPGAPRLDLLENPAPRARAAPRPDPRPELRLAPAPAPDARPVKRLHPGCRMVILGLDGAVVDTRGAILDELRQLMAETGAPMGVAEARERFMGAPWAAPMTHVALKTGRMCPAHFIEEWERRIALRLEAGVEALPGAAALLDALSARGVAVAAVTGASARLAALALERAGLAGRLAVFSADDAGRTAAPGDLLRRAAEQAAMPPGDCTAIADAAPEIGAARALGMRAIGQTGGRHLAAIRDAHGAKLISAGADFVLETAGELALPD